MNRKLIAFLVAGLFHSSLFAYWQQKAEYTMDVKLDVSSNRFQGTQKLVYYNQSPDILTRVYYHLYFNAFRPNSEMDVRSRSLPDPDKRVGARVFHLKENEVGYQKVISLKQNGQPLQYKTQGTILEVILAEPVKPGGRVIFEMEFEGQVPVQIRRSGRDNAEGIRYSMSQWYPKLCEYDREGWHTDPYIGREFHGVWGNFDVRITLDSSYLIGGTGVLVNAQEIGKGYEKPGSKVKRKEGNELTWHFRAENVHDFVWAADPDFVHYSVEGPNKTIIHCIYQPDSITSKVWPDLGGYMSRAIEVMNREVGLYPYPQYSIIQGGDGGMEYPMATLITGRRNLGSLVGVSVHELLHSWFQGMLAFDESHYYWMDEGFTEFWGEPVMKELFGEKKQVRKADSFLNEFTANPFQEAYDAYIKIAGTAAEQPLTTHADWFESNQIYGIQAYNKGCVFLAQLKHLVGEEVFKVAFREFFETWKMKHPEPSDLKIIFEKRSGMELDWYFEQFVQTTHTIDYGIRSVTVKNGKVQIRLERIGSVPMPLDLWLVGENGRREHFYIPVDVQRGTLEQVKAEGILEDWRWVDKEYILELDNWADLNAVYLDPGYFWADTDRRNNQLYLR